MKILVLSGVNPKRERFGAFARSAPSMQPYATLCLAAVCEQYGYTDIKVIDTEVRELTAREIVDIARSYGPDVVGITVHSITRTYCSDLLNAIRKDCGNATLVAGGPHVKLYPGDLVENGAADYCVSGEADFAFADLVRAIDRGESLEEIPNMVFRRNGETVHVPDRPMIQDMDSLPYPSFHLIADDMRRYHPQVMIYRRRPWTILLSSRGCPYSCTFCPSARMWAKRKWRMHSAEYVVGMMEHVQREFGIREVCFNDCSFAINRKRVYRICELIKERGLRMTWSANVNLEGLDDQDMLCRMREAGCWLVSCGIETGNDEIMKSIRKPLTIAEAEATLRMIDRAGIRIRGYFMLGHLKDTQDTIQQTIDFSKAMPLYSANYSILSPIPGSEIYEALAGSNPECEWSLSSWGGDKRDKLFAAEGLTADYLLDVQKCAFREFFLRPSQLWILLREIRSVEDIRKYMMMVLTAFEAFWERVRPRSDHTHSDAELSAGEGYHC